jgi:hypothetical protein
MLRLLQIFANQLTAAEAHTWAALAGYKLTPAEIQTLFANAGVRTEVDDGVWQDPATFAHWIAALAGETGVGVEQERLPGAGQEIFVGREPELARLYEHLDSVLARQGRVVLVSGTAGSGKTSIDADLRTSHPQEPPTVARAGGQMQRLWGIWRSLYTFPRDPWPAGRGSKVSLATQLAIHFQRAGMPEKAVPYLLRSGQRAMHLSIHEESIPQLRQGLALLAQLPPSARRDRQEFELLLTLGTSLISSQGFSFPEVGEVYARALDLCNQVGDESERASILFNLWVFYARGGDYLTAMSFAQQLMALADQTQDEALRLQAHHAMWTQSLYAGDFTAAHFHAECGVALYKVTEHHPLTYQYGGHDPGVCSRIFDAYALWYLGYPDRSLQRIQAAVALAREVAQVFSLAMALTLAAEVHLLRREGEAALGLLQEAYSLAEKHNFSNWLELGAILRGWALVQLGEAAQGIEEMLHGIHANQEMTGKETGLHCFAQLAEAYGAIGKPADGLALRSAALATEDKSRLRHWDQWQSDLYRLQGELSLMQSADAGPPDRTADEAEQSFLRAIDIARQQGAKLPELRAVTTLCHLLLRQGRVEEAQRLLQQTYEWFTEGFDTKDLRAAKALLEQLA